MSLAHTQQTCACCGKSIKEDENINIEPLVDRSVRYVITHWDCTTFPTHPDLTATTVDAHTADA